MNSVSNQRISVCLEDDTTSEDVTYPERGALDLKHWYNEEEEARNNCSLDAKRLQCAVLCRPWDLEVRDGETSKRPGQVDEPRDLALMAREAVVTVRI